ncbi:MAG TPA: ribosome small subunit-dependent GTPase A, partial [Candidatus Berkiella sp.]|nr:ribosome small subunit-dependent GTPase A [Candidatus Berkiella sp.]
MTKNRLTHRQIKQQKKIQADRLSRAEQGHSLEQPGLLVAHYGTTLIVENPAGQLFKCKLRQNLGTLVTGDNVIWQPIDEHTGIVVACQERHSVITKPYKHTTKPVVANVDRMIVVLALAPIPQATTLDRYLVVAHHLQLPVTIVLNKWDLLSSPQHDALTARIEAYTKLGFPFTKVSNKTKIGLDELRAQLNQHTSILVGQSGVGKSSLINAMTGLDLRT